mmetsp:Transcript_4965/g.13878  ORF Transcript_4965/g.13878 Transcript_4965/m.13878 type:complete len:83 (-) Transcript_4965:366-614(-)
MHPRGKHITGGRQQGSAETLFLQKEGFANSGGWHVCLGLVQEASPTNEGIPQRCSSSLSDPRQEESLGEGDPWPATSCSLWM